MHKIIETRVDDWLDSVEDQLFNDLRTKTANEILNSLAKISGAHFGRTTLGVLAGPEQH